MSAANSPVPLCRANLSKLGDKVRVPQYDTNQVQAGIVHLGLGNFHRAHMARYTHDLMQKRPDDTLQWGIVGAGLMPSDIRMYESLHPQDNLYTLVERDDKEERVGVIGSLADVIFAGESSRALLDVISRPTVRIVSLTVTENGYCLNRFTKRLDAGHVLIQKDLAQPEEPASAIGILVESFRRRMVDGLPPFTAMTCDNIQENGNILRQAVIDLAELRDPALATWIKDNAVFPCTMVDRITPVTAAHEVEALAKDFGIADQWPVFCETFTQWVIEDHFPQGRPAWEDVGAQFVEDVMPYEFMKLRLLNGSHLAVAGLGQLAGYETIDESMANPLISGMMVALMDREIEPHLLPVPGIDLPEYKKTLIERFSNKAIRDTVQRVNTDAPLNVLMDPIKDRLKEDQPLDILALALAAWLRRMQGTDEQGNPLVIRHPLVDQLREKALEGRTDPRPLLSISDLFGTAGQDPRLIEPVERWLVSLYERGARETLLEASRQLKF